MKIIRTLAGLLAGFSLTASLAHAHSVWIEESPAKELVIRFGEFDAEYEKSPGYLDSLSLPVAWTLDAEDKPSSFSVEKKSDHFLLTSAAATKVAFGETDFPVMKRGKRASWPHFYVRWLPAAAPTAGKPELTLDIVPTGVANEFAVYFRGTRLPNATVQVHGGGKEVDLKTDAQGTFQFKADSGLVLLTCNYKEELKGFSGGVAYDVSSHNTAISWRQP